MATVSVTLPSDGQTIDASDVNTPINTIVNEINGSLDADNIANGSITNAKLDTTAGELGGAWVSFTPEWTNLTPGSGTNTGYYTQVGKTVIFKVKFVFGSGSAVGTSPTLTLPVEASTTNMTTSVTPMGAVQLLDASTATYSGLLRYGTSTTASIVVLGAGGTYVNQLSVSATVPITWGTADSIEIVGYYEAA